MANPIQQGLKHVVESKGPIGFWAAMANPIQQGLKPDTGLAAFFSPGPQWLIQYNKDWNPAP